VHGYDQRENIRLQDQASTLVEILHSDTFYPAGSEVLEAGLIDEKTFDDGVKGLYRTTATDGVFCYTFFKAIAIKY